MTPADDSSSRGRGLTDHALRLVTREATRLPLFALMLGRTLMEQGLPAIGGDLPACIVPRAER